MRGAGQNEGGVSSNSSWQSGDKHSEKVLTNSERGFYGDSSQCTKIDVGKNGRGPHFRKSLKLLQVSWCLLPS